MRNLKFRAWSKKEGCWCGAFSIHKSGMVSDMIDAEIDKDSGLALSDAHWGENDLEVTQFTGLQDIDNTDIYEGDILFFSYGIPPVRVHAEVVYRNGRYDVLTPGHTPSSCPLHELKETVGEYEVFGNIYQDAELLT